MYEFVISKNCRCKAWKLSVIETSKITELEEESEVRMIKNYASKQKSQKSKAKQTA